MMGKSNISNKDTSHTTQVFYRDLFFKVTEINDNIFMMVTCFLIGC
jgi:hypothetical protein